MTNQNPRERPLSVPERTGPSTESHEYRPAVAGGQRRHHEPVAVVDAEGDERAHVRHQTQRRAGDDDESAGPGSDQRLADEEHDAGRGDARAEGFEKRRVEGPQPLEAPQEDDLNRVLDGDGDGRAQRRAGEAERPDEREREERVEDGQKPVERHPGVLVVGHHEQPPRRADGAAD